MSSISRRDFLQRGAAGLAAGALLRRAGAATPPRPNVIFIITDDQNMDTIGCYGGHAHTPHIDGLARDGVLFTRQYVTSPLCSASRYTCLTGRYGGHCRSASFLRANPPDAPSNIQWNTQLEPELPNLAKVLQANGYTTGCVGKWHVGGGPNPSHRKWPQDGALDDPAVAGLLAKAQEELCAVARSQGFDYAASMYSGNLADYRLDALQWHNPEWITAGGLQFLEQSRGKPFFLYFSTTLHHGPGPQQSLLNGDPRMTPAGLLDVPRVQPSRASVRQSCVDAGLPPQRAFCTWLDDCVGALLGKLEEIGIADNTAVFYYSDNGNPGKATCYEPAGHTACLLKWPDHLAAGTRCERLVGNIDIVPTILDICFVKPPADYALDGRSVVPLLRGETNDWRESLLLDVGHVRAAVTERHKYIAIRYPPKVQQAIANNTLGRPPYQGDVALDTQIQAARVWPHYFDPDQLYDLQEDPGEKTNLATDPANAALLADMKGRLKGHLAGVGRPFGELYP